MLLGRHMANLAKRSGYSRTSFWRRFQTALSSIRSYFIREPTASMC